MKSFTNDDKIKNDIRDIVSENKVENSDSFLTILEFLRKTDANKIKNINLFLKFFQHTPMDMRKFCQTVYTAINSALVYKKSEELINCLKKYQTKFDIETFRQCLQATKAFINSREFHFSGKWHTKMFQMVKSNIPLPHHF